MEWTPVTCLNNITCSLTLRLLPVANVGCFSPVGQAPCFSLPLPASSLSCLISSLKKNVLANGTPAHYFVMFLLVLKYSPVWHQMLVSIGERLVLFIWNSKPEFGVIRSTHSISHVLPCPFSAFDTPLSWYVLAGFSTGKSSTTQTRNANNGF